MDKEEFLAYFAKKSQTKVETDGIQITRVLSSTIVTSVQLAFAEDENKSHKRVLRNMWTTFQKRQKRRLAYTQEISKLRQQSKRSLSDIRSILSSEPQ